MTAVEPTTKEINQPRDRRSMLCGLAVALVAPGALVAACGSDSGTSDTSGATSGGTTGDPGGQAGGAGGTPLADIPDGGGLIVDGPDGGKVLLVRDGGDVKAFDAACTHRGTIVAAPTDGVATCPSHGSEFDTATGKPVTGPATEALAEVAVTVEGDQVTFA